MSLLGRLASLVRSRTGVSLIELVVTMAILSILAALVIPSAQLTGKRIREIELKRSLRTVRTAIDKYNEAYVKAFKPNLPPPPGPTSGYPEKLDVLVEGWDPGTSMDNKQSKMKFLRRIPVDPFNPPGKGEKPKWGFRAYKDEPDSKSSAENPEDVFDVFSLSEGTAIDGTKYKDW